MAKKEVKKAKVPVEEPKVEKEVVAKKSSKNKKYFEAVGRILIK